jgi:hypothetical protein
LVNFILPISAIKNKSHIKASFPWRRRLFTGLTISSLLESECFFCVSCQKEKKKVAGCLRVYLLALDTFMSIGPLKWEKTIWRNVTKAPKKESTTNDSTSCETPTLNLFKYFIVPQQGLG